MTETNKVAFSGIYASHIWQGLSLSGPGSDGLRTIEFRSLLEQLLRREHIRTVVDLGCGDWSYSRLINWADSKYLGIDIVQSVIEENQIRFATPTISFLCLDATREDLPQADLLIVKEVLQHLPIKDIHSILAKAQTYRFALFVNDISHHVRGTLNQLWRWQSIGRTNIDIKPGGYRLLALREPPFSLAATQLLTYRNEYKGRRWEKEVLLWSRSSGY